QIIRNGNGELSLLRAAPQIENLVLKGGGAKGIGYAPALKEMVATGMLDGLKQVVGTSAGALTALSIAVGQTPEELRDLGNMDLTPLFKTSAKLHDIYPEIHFQNTAKGVATLLAPIGAGHGEANKMIQLLDKVSGDKVSGHLKNM